MSYQTSDPGTHAENRPLRPTAFSINRLPILAAILLFFIPMALLPQLASGTVATSSEMQQVCQNWLTQKVYQQGSWAGEDNPQIVGSHDIYSGDTLVARWYDISPRGFVLVPVLKEMQPIKAYTDAHNLDFEQEGGFVTLIREMLSKRMSMYASRVGSLDAEQTAATEPVFGQGQRREWDRLNVDTKSFRSSLSTSLSAMSSAGPLLTSSWDQRAPYNNLCPMGDGDRTVVGCVATAISQIMNYWHWPENGYGSHTYTWAGDYSCDGSTPSQELSADFSDPYDWANMPDSCDEGCTATQEDAVAELCYEVGVAVNMEYGACGSGSYLNSAANSFSAHFKYSDDISIRRRKNYDLPGWFALIRNEIDNGRVCDYFISQHSIVLDGYRNEYGQYEYHMNYGWGGPFTTWFVFDSLYCYWEPDSLCPASWDAIAINIHPQTEPILSCIGVAIADPTGNDNGIAEPGEQIDLTPTVLNTGLATDGIVAVLSTDDPYIYDDGSPITAPVPSLDWGEQATSSVPLSFTVLPTCPDPHIVVFELSLSSGGGYEEVDTIQICAGTIQEPALSCTGVAIADPTGNGNGIAEPGERIEITPTVLNMGVPTSSILAIMVPVTPYIEFDGFPETSPVPALDFGEQAATTVPVIFAISPDCPDPYVVLFELVMAAGEGYQAVDTIRIYVGTTPGLEDDFESGQGNWTHLSPSSQYADQWHLDTYRKHSGSSNWKASGTGPQDYANNADCQLISPPFLLPTNAFLTFWHWIAAEDDTEPGTARDGATVYISSGDGNWTMLTPTSGYPYTIIDNSTSPYDSGTPCYSGAHDWSQAKFNLSAFSGVVQLKFRFGTDGAATNEGWYVDDISVVGNGCCGQYTGGVTGNTDCDSGGTMNLQDVTRLIDRIYLSQHPLCCERNGNINGDSEGALNLQDVTALIDHIYLSRNPTALCQ